MIKKFISYLIFSQIFVSANTALLAFFLQKAFSKVNIDIIWFVFFSTLFIYGVAKFFKEKNKKNNNAKSILKYVFIGFVGVVYFIFLIDFYQILSLIIPFVISILYNFPIGENKFLLRNTPYLKIFYIAFVWGFVCGVFSVGYDILLFFQIFFFVLGITIPFDIRDIENDEDIKTIPQVVGIVNSKIIAIISLVLSQIIMMNHDIDYVFKISFAIAGLYAIILVLFSSRDRSDLYYSFFMELSSSIAFIVFYSFNLTIL